MFNKKTFEAVQDIFQEVGKLSAVNEKNYQCFCALYFEDADESYHVLETQIKPLDLECLTEDFRGKLQEGDMSFEIAELDRNVSV